MPYPIHTIRTHSGPISHVAFSVSNRLLYSADQDGTVAVTDLSTRRVVASFEAHQGGVLGLAEWNGGLVSQGRDNTVKFHLPLATNTQDDNSSQPQGKLDTLTPLLPSPSVIAVLPINAINFCKLSLVDIPSRLSHHLSHLRADEDQGKSLQGPLGNGQAHRQGLMAVPNLLDSDSVSPTLKRL